MDQVEVLAQALQEYRQQRLKYPVAFSKLGEWERDEYRIEARYLLAAMGETA